MVNGELTETIQPIEPSRKSLSAAVNDPEPEGDPGGLARGANIGLNKLSPVTRNIEQKISDNARWAQSQINTAGLNLEGNAEGIASSRGGDIQTRAKQWEGSYFQATRKVEQIFLAQNQTSFKNIPGLRMIGFRQFSEEVGRALENGGVSANKHVAEAAKVYRDEVFLPIFREAKQMNMRGFADISDEEAMSYFPRQVNRIQARRDYDQFIEVLQENAEEKLLEKYQGMFNSSERRAKLSEQFADDIELDEDGAINLRQALESELKELRGGSEADEVLSQVEELQLLRSTLSNADDKKAITVQINKIREENKDALNKLRKEQREAKARLKNLDFTRSGIARKEQKALEQIEKIEQQQLSTLQTVVRQAELFKRKAARLGEEEYNAQLTKLEKQFEKVYKLFEKADAKIDELSNDVEQLVDDDLTPTDRLSKLEQLKESRRQKSEQALERLQQLQSFDRAGALELVEQTAQDMFERSNIINQKRSIRIDKLRSKAQKLSDLDVGKLSENARIRARTIRDTFAEQLEDNGGKISKGKIDISLEAQRIAEGIASKQLGDSARSPGVSLLGERGAEIARTLNIDPKRVWSNGRSYEDFLNRDVDHIARGYVRSLGADLEIFRTFGAVNPFLKGTEFGDKLAEDFAQARKKIVEDKTLTKEQKDKAQDKLAKDIDQIKNDLKIQIDRIRHIRGIPEDPSNIGFRAGRVLMNLNVLRQMGTVVPSSIADLGRPVLKFGLLDTFKEGWLPLVTNLKRIKMSKHEAQLSGTALDLVTHGRAAAMFDILEDVEYGSATERVIQQATNKMGIIALFDYWNVGMKSVTSSIVLGKMTKAIRDAAQGKADKSQLEFLASAGINADEAGGFAKLIEETGDLVDGNYWPNTERWTEGENNNYINIDYQRKFRAALAYHIDNTIITPGTERPNFVDLNTSTRLLMQFRTFTLSSTQKTTMALGQDVRGGRLPQAAVGVTMSLGLGALSYYVWAVSRGGDSYERMLNASPEEWADEAIARSGLLGVLGEIQRFGSNVPALQNLTTVSGRTNERSSFGEPLFDALGPSVSLAKDLQTIMMTVDDPTQRTNNAARRLVPLNNVFYLSNFFSQISGQAQ
jgi:hypothetical protein